MALVASFPSPAGLGSTTYSGAGTTYPVKTPSGNYYVVYIDSTSDVVYQKSTDGGLSWGAPVVVFAGTATQVANCYDRWSNISAGLIHCVYSESVTDDTFYRSIDTENSDALGTQTTVFAGSSTAGGGAISITRARGGNLYCKVTIDAGAEGGFFRSVDVGANWTSRTNTEALATTDQWALTPGFAADDQDIMCVFMDASASEISRYVYDNSGDSWAETSIATGITLLAAGTAFPNWAVSVDLTNSQILLGVWTASDVLNADLLFFTVSESAITAKTDVITNSADDQGLCAVGIDTDTQDWYVFYGGASDGGEVFNTSLGLYYKMSTDDGTTWGSETRVTPRLSTVNGMSMTMRFDTRKLVALPLSTVALMTVEDQPVAGSGGITAPMFSGGTIN